MTLKEYLTAHEGEQGLPETLYAATPEQAIQKLAAQSVDLTDEELAKVAGASFVESGHVCGDFGGFNTPEEVRYDFEVGTRVQVRHAHQVWRSWSATIIGRKPKYEFVYGTGMRYVPYYKVHFDGYNDSYDDWVEQSLLYI